jgi:hypothetical protein
MRASEFVAWLRRRRVLIGIIAGLIALYGAFGFWVAPGIVRGQIVKHASEALGRNVTLDEVRINPFALAVTLSRFGIEEADGKPIVAFDELYVNFSSTSAIRFAWTFSEVRLIRPRVEVVIREDSSLNLAALGNSASRANPPPTTEAKDHAAAGLPRVIVRHLVVTEGHVGVEDRGGKRPFQSSVDAISFSLENFSTLPDDEGQHAFAATTDLGERLAWRGRIGVNPIQSAGHIELTGIRLPRLAPYLVPETVEIMEGTLEAGADYDVKLTSEGNELSVTQGRLALHDVRVKTDRELTPLNLEFAPIALQLKGFLARPGSRATGLLEITPNGTGKIAVKGTFGIDPLTADLNVSVADMALQPWQTFVEPYAQIAFKGGAVHADGRFEMESAGAQAMHFEGRAALSDVSVVDSARGQEFARWRRLDVEKIVWNSQPPSLRIERIATDAPYLRFIIGPDRVTNVQEILGAATDSTRASAAPAKAAETQAPSAPMSVRIGVVTIRNGSANFADQSLKPNFATGLQELNGTVKGLSSQANARAVVSLRGKVDRYAPATIAGEINPLSAQAYSDIGLRFENIELTTFTPYSGKFAGRRIDKGKLNLNLHYRLVDRELVGENKIVFDQLTLGQPVEGPDVMSLPLDLAIAILQDRHGVIDVDLPVHGNIDDPEFSYAGIIWKALVNLIMKAVTAPFTLLASALGGGEELGYVAFAPGAREIGSSEQEKLDKLARALADRPQLRVEVRGASSHAGDRAALAEAKVMQQVRGPDALLDTPLTASEQRRLVSLYHKQLGEDPKPPDDVPAEERKARVIETARARLIEATPVTDDELRGLARDRGSAINHYLVTKGEVAAERVYLTEPNIGATAGGDGVRSELKLTVR